MTDASLATSRVIRSELGLVAMIADKEGQTYIIHYGSNRCRRVTRSVMVSELHALLLGFDSFFVMQYIISEFLGRKVEVDALIDYRTVFDIIFLDTGRKQSIASKCTSAN